MELLIFADPQDHPRGCGEHRLFYGTAAFGWGSSPRMRGAPAAGQQPCWRPRIIPADAGSTERYLPPMTGPGDHPRGCGEHKVMTRNFTPSGGSSPRMRGAPIRGILYSIRPGIIPADAGSTMG